MQKVIIISLYFGLSLLGQAAGKNTVAIDCVAALSGEDPSIRRFLLAHDVDVKWMMDRTKEYSAGIYELAQAGPEVDLVAAVKALKAAMTSSLNIAELGISDGGRFSRFEKVVSIKLSTSPEPQDISVKDQVFLHAKRLEFKRIEAALNVETSRLNIIAAKVHLERQGHKSFEALDHLMAHPRAEWWERTFDNAILESLLLFPSVEAYQQSVASFGQANIATGYTSAQLHDAIFNGVLVAPLALAFHTYVSENRISHPQQPTEDTYGETARKLADQFVRDVLSRSAALFAEP